MPPASISENNTTWRDLEFGLSEAQRSSHQFDVEGPGDALTVRINAFCDLDCDGTHCTVVRTGTIRNGFLDYQGDIYTEIENE